MVKPIMKDVLFLGQNSAEATKEDMEIVIDLQDTLKANETRCVGMAANMIGKRKRIIIVNVGFANVVMLNPQIIKKEKPYEAEEGCLSLLGIRKVMRYEYIELKYQDTNFVWHKQNFSGYVAQIIQHEVDHCNGIII